MLSIQTNNIRVELTATRRTALQRYTFPAGTANPCILVDITNDGQKSSTNPEMTLDPDTARVVGGASFSASFGPGKDIRYCRCELMLLICAQADTMHSPASISRPTDIL